MLLGLIIEFFSLLCRDLLVELAEQVTRLSTRDRISIAVGITSATVNLAILLARHIFLLLII